MDVCTHPEAQGLHGFTAWTGPRPGLLFPMFSFSGTQVNADLTLPALEQFDYPVGDLSTPWTEMKDKVVWRGSTTGSDLTNPHMQTHSQRPRLTRLVQANGTERVHVSAHDGEASLGFMKEVEADKGEMAGRWLDVRFAGPVAQCGDETSCARFKEGFEWGENMPTEEQNKVG